MSAARSDPTYDEIARQFDALGQDPRSQSNYIDWTEFALSIILRGGNSLEAFPAHWSAVERFAAFCSQHNIGETLFEALPRAALPQGLHREISAWMKPRSEKLAKLHLKLVGALSDISRIFDDSGLTWRLLKGPHLQESYYGGLARDYFDLDLLVPVHQFKKALSVLGGAGCARRSRGIMPLWLLRHFEHSIDLQQDEIPIDLHRAIRVRPAYRIDSNRMFSGQRTVQLGKVDVPVLEIKDDLLVALLSTAHNIERKRASIRDVLDLFFVSRVIETDGNWDQFFEERRPEGTLRICEELLAAMVVWVDRDNTLPELRNALRERAFHLPAPLANPLFRSICCDDDKAFGRRWYQSVYSGSMSLYRLHTYAALIANQDFPYNLPKTAPFQWLYKQR